MAKKVAVMGGGASGIMASISAASKGNDVTLFDQKDRVGNKLLLTGNGKCNFTNTDIDESHYHSFSDEGQTGRVLKAFSKEDTMAFFYRLGLFTKEKNGGIYPYTDTSATVLSLLKAEMKRLGVKVVTGFRAEEIKDDLNINGESFDAMILALGGKSFPKTGSDGSGFSMLEKLGCRIIKVLPALTPVTVNEDLSGLKGVRCRAILSLFINGINVQTASGELQPYEEGLSGICAMDISGLAIRALDEKKDVYVLCDFMPDMDEKELEDYLIRMKDSFPERNANGLLAGLFAEKLVHYLIHPLDSRKDSFIRDVVDTVKHHRFEVSPKMCSDFSRAQVVSGGLSFSEVNEKLMLKAHEGIYVCGELLDIYGDCGGYNLQWAFSSGYVAGKLS
ncbi:MAG: aminoacetone oxidase family FAD-binding enzyme [Lachnospiraceae bacterium]|nr:aminoacetone oxidase family FAD-binding enzyme [Lachnospiraceae bacterium]